MLESLNDVYNRLVNEGVSLLEIGRHPDYERAWNEDPGNAQLRKRYGKLPITLPEED